MSDSRRLVYAIVKFLQDQIDNQSSDLSEDGKESLEVASQCLQTAFSFSFEEDSHLKVLKSLENIFSEYVRSDPFQKDKSPSPEEKVEAERLKNEGNDKMRTEDFKGAVDLYSKAINIYPTNQVYYCNRAAAHSKMNDHLSAIDDCKRALDMDPKYGKAYGRLGLAYSSLNQHKQAAEAFAEAVKLEPDNESYKSNLKLAEDSLTSGGGNEGSAPTPNSMPNNIGGLFGNMDIGSYLNNPALMSMASTVMADPNMQNLMSQFVSGQMGGGAAPPPSQGGEAAGNGRQDGVSANGGAESGSAAGAGGLSGLLQAGQRLAEQIQSSNPDLVNQLRSQMSGQQPPEQQPPNNP